MNLPKRAKRQLYWEISLVGLLFLLWLWASAISLSAQAVDTENEPNAIYLPMVHGAAKATSTPVPTSPSATTTPTSSATPTVAPSVTTQPSATPTTPAHALPAELVGTWYSGNAPLNNFYDPTTGEWRDVNGLGQMYSLGANGIYSYTGFLRIQNGACRSEVSTFQQGVAQAEGDTLLLSPEHVKTRTVTICGSTDETITDGPYAPISQVWQIAEDSGGHEQLTVTANGATTTYYKAGMASSLVGIWENTPGMAAGFYDPATEQFNLDSPRGMWFDFGADSTYRYGEHDQGNPDEEGCWLEWWTYNEGTISVVGGKITVTPQTGTVRLYEPCHPETVEQKPWIDEVRDYTWLYRDRPEATKLVLIPLSRFIEFIFQRP